MFLIALALQSTTAFRLNRATMLAAVVGFMVMPFTVGADQWATMMFLSMLFVGATLVQMLASDMGTVARNRKVLGSAVSGLLVATAPVLSTVPWVAVVLGAVAAGFLVVGKSWFAVDRMVSRLVAVR